MRGGLEDPLVWELLPLGDRDRSSAREASKGVRAAVDQAWARRGVSVRARHVGMLRHPRWDDLAQLHVRDGIGIGAGHVHTLTILDRQTPFARLWKLHLRNVKFPEGFAWRREMLPALRDLRVESLTTRGTFARDAMQFADMYGAIVPQLRALEIKFESMTPIKDLPSPALAALTALTPAPHLLAYASAGHDILPVGVDAPLRALRLAGPSLASVGPAARATLRKMSVRGPAGIVRDVAAFRNLDTLFLVVGPLGTPASLRAAANDLRLLPATLRRLAVELEVWQLDEPHAHARSAVWPADALAHLAELEDLDVAISFPLDMGSLVRGLMGARPRLAATLRARSQLVAPLEEMLHNADLEDDDELADEIRTLVDYLESVPDVTPDDIKCLRGALPSCALTLHGLSIF